jgi:nucleotide-binding universal stress UspA family protein
MASRALTVLCMTRQRAFDPAERPFLLCTGTDPAMAARLAQVAVSLLAKRSAIVLATWHAPPMTGPKAALDALYDADLQLRAVARDAAAAAAGAALDVLDARGVKVWRRLSPEEIPPWHVALEIAEEVGASVIVAGTSEAPAARPGALGREARALAHRSTVPLLLVPPGAKPAPDGAPAVLAYDDCAPAAHALQRALELLTPRPAIAATAWETTSHAVGAALLAVPAGVARTAAERLDESARSHAAGVAAAAGMRLAYAGWNAETTPLEARHSVAAALIDLAAEHDAGVIVTGTRGRSRVSAALLGSTAEALVRHAGRPVLLVPSPS